MASIELASAVAELTAVCLKTTMSLAPLISKIPPASSTIVAIQFECTALGASLSQVQSFLLQDTALRDQLAVGQAFDTVVTGCRVLFACLEEKIEKLSHTAPSSRPWSLWGIRVAAQMTWSEEEMQDYLQRLKDQCGAVKLLMEMSKINPVIQEPLKNETTNEAMQWQTAATKSLRAANPDIIVPASVIGVVPQRQGSQNRGPKTTYNQEFAFDNLLVNSEAYRRSMGIPPSRVVRETRVESTPGNTWPQDDELPEYTPYPTTSASQPLQANYGYVPQTRAVFGFPNAPAPKPTPSGWIPPTWVPGSLNESRALEVTPDLIRYTTPLDEEAFFPVRIHNPNTSTIQFRVRTSAPRKYCVRPNRGVIEAGAAITVQFVLVPKEDAFPKEQCRDKFLIESVVVKMGESFEWGRDEERRNGEIAKMKIRVEFVDQREKMEKEG